MYRSWLLLFAAVLSITADVDPAAASSGYFSPGYGPISRQMVGATTALTGDAFTGSSNPAKLLAAGNRTEIGVEFFTVYREIERTGSLIPSYNFKTKSENWLFLIPEGAISRPINDRLAWGITVYGNGGLNTEFRDTNGARALILIPECVAPRREIFWVVAASWALI